MCTRYKKLLTTILLMIQLTWSSLYVDVSNIHLYFEYIVIYDMG